MDFHILCFGRTEFTRLTVDSILRNAAPGTRIQLINNGWNERIVPREILQVWRDFVDAYRQAGKIHSVLEIANPAAGGALNAFSALPSSQEPYHFITDNDCLVSPSADGKPFDTFAVELMDANPGLWKLGAFLYRKISESYCRRYETEGLRLEDYLPIPWGGDDRFSVNDDGMQDYADYTATKRETYQFDARIWMIPTDTTLSIVRNPHRVSETKRLSPTVRGIEVLHIGYLEPYFISRTNEASTMEVMYYHFLRPRIMLQFADDYRKRAVAYFDNLRKSGHGKLLQEFNRRYLRKG